MPGSRTGCVNRKRDFLGGNNIMFWIFNSRYFRVLWMDYTCIFGFRIGEPTSIYIGPFAIEFGIDIIARINEQYSKARK